MTAPETHARLGFRDRVERAWPFSLFFNPVFQKEMRAAGHRSGTYIARGIYGGLMFGIVTIALVGAVIESQGASSDAQALQQLAPLMAVVLAWFGLFMLAFIAPVMTVPAFMDERRRRTLPVLMTTPLTSAQIVCAKLASQTIQLLILALLGLPVVLGLRIFGGVPASFLLQSNAILLSAALLVSTIGLRFSLYRQRSDVAIVAAFVTAAFIQFGPILLIGVAQWAGASNRILVVMPITCSPIALATITAELMGGGGGPPWGSAGIWLGHTVYNLAWSLIFILTTILQLRRVLRLEGAGINYLKPGRRERRRAALSLDAPAPAAAGAPAPPESIAPPPPAADRHPREVGDRPVLWRELRQATFRTRRGAILTTAGLAIVILILYSRIEINDVGLHMLIAIPALLFILLRAAAGSTASFTSERESRTLETLLTTPLSAREIVWSKFLGALRRQWYTPAILFTHLLLMAALGALHPVILLHTAIILAGAIIFLSATGILLGLIIRRSTTASIANICVGLILWAGLPGLLALIAEFLSFTRSFPWEPIGTFLFMINPLGQLISSIEGASHSNLAYGSPGFGTYPLWIFTLFMLASSLGYALISFALLALSARLFTASAGRTS
ncbi:MAG: ABC transporter permease subunit [Phycisphaerales bacterium]|nr:ABC transporter permease subunit [Phycisphaerales bacterium]